MAAYIIWTVFLDSIFGLILKLILEAIPKYVRTMEMIIKLIL